MRRTIGLVWGVGVLLGAVIAAAQADPIKIRIGWIAEPASRAGYLMEKPELLHHYGQSYTVEAMHFSSTPAQLQALASGDLDIAQLGYSTLGAAVENAHMDDVRIIADELEDGKPGWSTARFTVLKDSPIKTIDDLKGKVVATNGLGTGPRYRAALGALEAPSRSRERLHRCRDQFPQHEIGTCRA